MAKAKFDVYTEINNKVMEQLESGIIPWKKSWKGAVNVAYNRITKKPYSFLNQLMLGKGGEFATFKQWSELGGKVRKGEKCSQVFFWKMIETEEVKDNGEVVKKIIPLLRYYSVFHISQVEGVEPLEDYTMELNDNANIDSADKVIENYTTREGIKVVTEVGGNRCFYNKATDEVHLPMITQFNNSNEYYSTAFHELVHSTGAETRLNRSFGASVAFGDVNYAREELVAEMGASYITSILGIATADTETNNVAYIQSWLKALANDTKLFVVACGKAEKATEYILATE